MRPEIVLDGLVERAIDEEGVAAVRVRCHDVVPLAMSDPALALRVTCTGHPVPDDMTVVHAQLEDAARRVVVSAIVLRDDAVGPLATEVAAVESRPDGHGERVRRDGRRRADDDLIVHAVELIRTPGYAKTVVRQRRAADDAVPAAAARVVRVAAEEVLGNESVSEGHAVLSGGEGRAADLQHAHALQVHAVLVFHQSQFTSVFALNGYDDAGSAAAKISVLASWTAGGSTWSTWK